MAAVQFFRSVWPEIRCNAALFVGRINYNVMTCNNNNNAYLGYMMGNLPKTKSNIVSKEHVCEGKFTKFSFTINKGIGNAHGLYKVYQN